MSLGNEIDDVFRREVKSLSARLREGAGCEWFWSRTAGGRDESPAHGTGHRRAAFVSPAR
jgi:hypothetical protein